MMISSLVIFYTFTNSSSCLSYVGSLFKKILYKINKIAAKGLPPFLFNHHWAFFRDVKTLKSHSPNDGDDEVLVAHKQALKASKFSHEKRLEKYYAGGVTDDEEENEDDGKEEKDADKIDNNNTEKLNDDENDKENIMV